MNYVLVEIVPPEGTPTIRAALRPPDGDRLPFRRTALPLHRRPRPSDLSPARQLLRRFPEEHEGAKPGAEREPVREAAAERLAQDAIARLRLGGPIAAALRALVYVLSGERSLDERASAVLVQITANSPALQELAFGGFGDLLGDQQMIMRLEPQRGLDVMPDMLSDADDADMDARAMALRARNRIATVGGPLPKDGQARLASPGAAPEKRALIALRRKMEPEVSTRRP